MSSRQLKLLGPLRLLRPLKPFPGTCERPSCNPISLLYSEHKDTGMYQGDVTVYCNQLWGATFKRYKQDPTVNLEELHDAHMRRLNERLG